MSRLTPLILAVIVGLLGYFAYRQTQHEAETAVVEATPLFPGVELRRVAAIRLENIDSSRHMRFEKDPLGRWQMTEPVAWPTEPGFMDQILGVIQRNGATVVPQQLMEEAEPSFSPPRGFLETTEILESGEKRLVRVEIGVADLDGLRVYVRRDGEILRTARNIETLMRFNSADFRSKSLLDFSPSSVVELERIGGWYEGDSGESLDFLARPEGYGWRIHKPARVQGDPDLMVLWSRFLSSARAKRFSSDRADVDLSRYNLHEPWVTIKVTTNLGVEHLLHVSAELDRDKIYARREGLSTIFELDVTTALKLREPVTSFYEAAFVRVPRDRLRHVWISREESELRFTLKGKDWTVATRPRGMDGFGLELAADADVMSDMLLKVEKASVLRYFDDVGVNDFFKGGRSLRGLWLEPTDDIRQGGFLGELVQTPQGTDVVPFLREGDSIVGSLAPEISDFTELPLEAFLQRRLWALKNITLDRLEIERDGEERAFKRTQLDDWQPADADVRARDLDPVLDHLLFLWASQHVAEGEREELTDVINVRFRNRSGDIFSVSIGVTPSGEAQASLGAMRATLKRQQLHADLMAIMDKKPVR